ncbi:CsbD family protein [Tahibacter sp. UC22_41]|uniref:CsbD family protein n=1 Tax=Tahibacter sp. UC22_41 TaxID=3350178 RepID=UPI0036DD7BFB
MNTDIIKGKWKQLSGQTKAQWNKLTDDDLGVVEGNREYLVGKLQERYGWARDRAETEVNEFESRLN